MARPKSKIDWKKVNELLEADCEGTEIAAHLGIHPDTLYLRCQKEHKMGFSEYLRQKKAKGNSLLKQEQYKKALSGDKALLIWLGKQRLGQKDKVETKATNLNADLTKDIELELEKLSPEEKKVVFKLYGIDDTFTE